MMRKLTVLTSMGAAAERALRSSRKTDLAVARDPVTGLQNTHFMAAYLTHALDLEASPPKPVSLLCVGISKLQRIGEEHGSEMVDAILQCAAQSVVQTVRQSDIVARHDDRIVVALLSSSVADALRVARSVQHAIFEAGVASAVSFKLTCSVGVAGFPEHAHDAESLLDAVFAAYETARQTRKERVSLPPGFVMPVEPSDSSTKEVAASFKNIATNYEQSYETG